MSSTLTWKPLKSRGDLPDGLKHALQKRYGTIHREQLTNRDLDYLKGLKHAGIKGADKLITLIEKHGEIEIDEEF